MGLGVTYKNKVFVLLRYNLTKHTYFRHVSIYHEINVKIKSTKLSRHTKSIQVRYSYEMEASQYISSNSHVPVSFLHLSVGSGIFYQYPEIMLIAVMTSLAMMDMTLVCCIEMDKWINAVQNRRKREELVALGF